MIRLLVVDDQQGVRQGLRMRLALEPDIAVVGEAADGPSAVRMAADRAPDAVIMDVGMPGMDGIEAAAAVRVAAPDAQVVILTVHDDPNTRRRAQMAVAAAFVVKQKCGGDLVAAIRRVAGAQMGDDSEGPGSLPADRDDPPKVGAARGPLV
ncbi:MAG: response regulator transcription factor [bacterium]|nr:response regulator transcription factor [bacterium]